MAGSSKKGAAWSWRRLALGAACVAGLGAAGYLGCRFLPRATAQPAAPAKSAAVAPPAAPTAPPADYCQRPVAFLHGNETITREQLGEYLIARYGADKLPLLVNKLIIEEACRAKGIDVTPAEVEASFAQDIASMGGGITEKIFVDNILKQYKKTLFEWKEDVVRPKLLMSKLVRDRVKVTEEEIRAGYEAYYGEKIDCKIIYWPKSEKDLAIKIWGIIHDSKDVDAEFDNKAMMQANPRLAAQAGKLDQPIGRHTTGDEELERLVFSLQPGQISAVTDTRDGIVVVKCLKRIPPDTTVSLEAARPRIYKEVFDKKVQMAIPDAFKELQQQAHADLLLKDPNKPQDLTETTRQLLSDGTSRSPAKGVVPAAGRPLTRDPPCQPAARFLKSRVLRDKGGRRVRP